jgi:hypothetical protein
VFCPTPVTPRCASARVVLRVTERHVRCLEERSARSAGTVQWSPPNGR